MEFTQKYQQKTYITNKQTKFNTKNPPGTSIEFALKYVLKKGNITNKQTKLNNKHPLGENTEFT